MLKDLDAVETKVVEILKDFNDQMKKLFGEAQNMCSVSLQEYRPQLALLALCLSEKHSLPSTPRPCAKPQPPCSSFPNCL